MEEAASESVVVVFDDSVVVGALAEEGAVVDEVAPEPLVVETASCASVNSVATAKKNAANEAVRNRLMFGSRGSEPRLEQETSKRFVASAFIAVVSVVQKSQPPLRFASG